ncbi:hypothetical protein [Streptomyces sp. T12]|uniref:hypothetical protein n=1 Tax=unclassified Streptomyces TaxID=2593676 RepID=UPI0027D269A4|nr:hypothetical protein [Streptomyces sp. T12]
MGAGGHEVVVDERHVAPGRDWASGYTELRCADGQFLVGCRVRGSAVSAALYAAAPAGRLGTSGRTVWFDRGGGDRGSGRPGPRTRCTAES